MEDKKVYISTSLVLFFILILFAASSLLFGERAGHVSPTNFYRYVDELPVPANATVRRSPPSDPPSHIASSESEYTLPSEHAEPLPAPEGKEEPTVETTATSCDLFDGVWVKDEAYPLYSVGDCPYVDEAFDCGSNGRQDTDYLGWRWKPNACDLPRFNASNFLERLSGKRVMLVGDSMNRNQFESLLCILREGLSDKSRMFEIHGRNITKGRGFFVFKFPVSPKAHQLDCKFTHDVHLQDYNCTVEFVRSHFLVKEGFRVNGQGNKNPTLSIDQIDKTARKWKGADILIFNTGHWWTHSKTARGKNYYMEKGILYPQFDPLEAYRMAIRTWGLWVKQTLNLSNKLIFYRGYSSAHFRGGDWDSGGTCYGETQPILSGAALENYPEKMKIVEEVIQKEQIPVKLLNVTKLTNGRKDGHPSIYGKNVTLNKKGSKRRQDCSHWCLPGVPDAWNELIYATLVMQQGNFR